MPPLHRSLVQNNFDEGDQAAYEFYETEYFEASKEVFPTLEGAFKFPLCKTMKLDRPKNLKGIDFSSLKSLDTLEVSFVDPKTDLQQSESQLKQLISLLQNAPVIKRAKVSLSCLTSQTFISVVH